ncbi:MAG: FAD-linked oxidase C-terminal domain-containing protein [Pseudomonadota bacterium]
MNDADKQAVQGIVGAENFSDALIDMVTYSYDASDHDHRPEAAAWPATTAQVSAILALANTRGFAVTPRGAGTSLAGGAVPAQGGLVLDLARMNRILAVNIEDRQAVVEPGVVYADLQKALARHGFCFPPDPASGKVCTIGGNVATNAGGIRGAKYGTTRDYVLALEVVLPDGRVTRIGSRCMKSVSGLDLTRLFVGSEGVLGVITEITLKVNPKPLAFCTCQASFETLDQAGRAVTAIMHSGVVPSVMEIMDENTIRVLREKGGLDLPQVRAMLLVETDGYTAGEADFQMERVLAIFRANQAYGIQMAETPEQVEALWAARRRAGSTAGQLRPYNLSEDVTVPMSQLPALLTGIARIVEGYGLPFVVFGHAGDGNLHPKIMYDRRDPVQVTDVHKAADEIFALTCSLGGTLTGEHGVGLAKAPYMGLEHDDVALELMRGIKRLVDPHNILNPGKMSLDD